VTGYIPTVYPPADGHLSNTNPAVHGQELNSQAVDHKSDARLPGATPPSQPL